jgi:RNA polymerase sigma-70 factor (ECF subfamily)
LIEGVSRERWRRALASLVGYVGDFDLAEESTQKAFAITLRARDDQPTGLPGGPGPRG